MATTHSLQKTLCWGLNQFPGVHTPQKRFHVQHWILCMGVCHCKVCQLVGQHGPRPSVQGMQNVPQTRKDGQIVCIQIIQQFAEFGTRQGRSVLLHGFHHSLTQLHHWIHQGGDRLWQRRQVRPGLRPR